MDDLGVARSASSKRSVLLLSGGIDSAAIAKWVKLELGLFIDYGQRPAAAEWTSAKAVGEALNLKVEKIAVNTASIGSGLLSDVGRIEGSPSDEWWPYRNQMLVTFAGAWLIRADLAESEILVGSVRPDRERHRDGGPEFYRRLNELLEYQEGDISVRAPAVDLTTEELVVRSDIGDDILGWTHSCHVAITPCLGCPGCYKREQILDNLGRLQ